MNVSFYVNRLIHIVQSIIVQNQGINVGCAIKCQVLKYTTPQKNVFIFFSVITRSET